MTAYENACLEQGAQRERRRIYALISNLPLGECKCERWLTEMYAHADTCEWNNEITYRSKLLDAITTPAESDERHRVVPVAGSPDSAGAAADVSGLEASEASGA